MARKPGRWSYARYVIGNPALLCAGIFAFVADHPLQAAIVGLLVGVFIGIALMFFPNLDRGGPADTDNTLN